MGLTVELDIEEVVALDASLAQYIGWMEEALATAIEVDSQMVPIWHFQISEMKALSQKLDVARCTV